MGSEDKEIKNEQIRRGREGKERRVLTLLVMRCDGIPTVKFFLLFTPLDLALGCLAGQAGDAELLLLLYSLSCSSLI